MKKKLIFTCLVIAISVFTMCICVSCDVIHSLTNMDKSKFDKLELTEEMLKWSEVNNTYVYDGEPIELSKGDFKCTTNGKYSNYEDFEFTYKDNDKAGTASVTITAKESNIYVMGSVTLYFAIEQGIKDVYTYQELADVLQDSNYKEISIRNEIAVPQNKTLTIPEWVILDVGHEDTFKVDGTLINNGKIIVKGGTKYKGGNFYTRFLNKGTVTNNNSIEIAANGFLFNSGVINSSGKGTVLNKGVIYADGDTIENLTNEDNGNVVLRKDITDGGVIVKETVLKFKQNVTEYRPDMDVYIAKKEIIYENNTVLGEAKLTIVADDFDTEFYGSMVVTFTIIKGTATVSSYNELKQEQETGNYDEYVAESVIEIPSNETFTLRAGVFKGEVLKINGKFINDGIVNASQIDIQNGGNLTNNNICEVSGNVNITGSVDNNENAECNINGIAIVYDNSEIVNGGTLNINETRGNGKLTNKENAILKVNTNAYTNVDFENSGKITFGKSYFEYKCSIKNNENGEIRFEDDVTFAVADVVNEGKIINKKKMLFKTITVFENVEGGVDNSNGQIWTIAELQNLSENVILKKLISDDSVEVELEYYEVEYDGTEKKPEFTVDGEKLADGTYSVFYEYENQNSQSNNITEAGTVIVTITITDDYYEYFGECTLSYIIKRVTYVLEDQSLFKQVTYNPNFSKIILNTDVNIESYMELHDKELDINGKKFNLSYSYLSMGTITNTVLGGEINILNNGKLYNYGTINNGAVIYVGSETAEITNKNSGKINNSGILYVCNDIETSGNGIKYVRKSLAKCKDEGKLSLRGYMSYDGTEKEPELILSKNSQEIEDANRFEVTYSNNVNVGTGIADVRVKDKYDVNYLGSVQLTFEINYGTCNITKDTVINGEDSVFYNENYNKYVLKENVSLWDDIIAHDGIMLDFGIYDIQFGSYFGTYYGSLGFAGEYEICVEVDSVERFDSYKNIANKMKLVSDICDTDLNTDDIVLLEVKENENTHIGVTSTNGLELDLNGYSINGRVQVYNNEIPRFNFIINDTSTNSTGSIGAAYKEAGLFFRYSGKSVVASLNGITVYGLEINSSGNGGLRINATDCKFTVDNNNQNITYAVESRSGCLAEFQNCTIESRSAVCIYEGTLNFYDCEIESTELYFKQYDKKITGNGITINNWYDLGPVNVNVSGGVVKSSNGYSVEIVNKKADIKFESEGVAYDFGAGKSSYKDDVE